MAGDKLSKSNKSSHSKKNIAQNNSIHHSFYLWPSFLLGIFSLAAVIWNQRKSPSNSILLMPDVIKNHSTSYIQEISGDVFDVNVVTANSNYKIQFPSLVETVALSLLPYQALGSSRLITLSIVGSLVLQKITRAAAQTVPSIVDINSANFPKKVFYPYITKSSVIGDIDKDGKPEFLFGSGPYGEVNLMWGNSSDMGEVNLTEWDSLHLGVRFNFNGISGRIGDYIADDVADFNGDGKPEIFFSAQYENSNNRGYAGSAFLIWGSASLPKITNITNWNENNFGIRFDGAAGDNCGLGISGVPDLNGDSKGEILIGATSSYPTFGSTFRNGKVYLIWGNSSLPKIVDLQEWDSNNFGVRFDGVFDSATGYIVKSIPDINGDKKPEIIITTLRGTAYLIWGNDSLPKVVDLTQWNTTIPALGILFKAGSISSINSVADINSDGKPEIMIGAGYDSRGSLYLIWGSASLPPIVDLALWENNTYGIRFDGAAYKDYLGGSSSGVPDINGDGKPEIVISAPGDNTIPSVYLLWGNQNLPAIVSLSSWNGTLGIRFDGLYQEYLGSSVNGLPDMDGDKRGEILISSGSNRTYLILSRALNFTTPIISASTVVSTLNTFSTETTTPKINFTTPAVNLSGSTVTSSGTPNNSGTNGTTISADLANGTGTTTQSILTTVSGSSSSSASMTSMQTEENKPSENTSNAIIYAAAGGGGALFLSLLAGLAIYLRQRAKKNNLNTENTTELAEKPSGTNTAHNSVTADSLANGELQGFTTRGSAASENLGELDFRTLQDLQLPHKDITTGKELGRGGFGVVYEGKWNGKVVAIKQLTSADFSGKLEQDFLQEVLTMSKLHSPNVVQLFGACIDQKPYALVMEYMKGGSLYRLLHSEGTLEWDSRINIILDTGRGLSYLHDKNIIHRDLKSPNILLTKDREAKLSDFGLSTVKSTSTQATKHEGVVGSICWMAPELLTRGTRHSEKSDVYSYGMVMWEIASREIPYKDAQGKTELIMQWIKEGQTENEPEGTPKEVWEVIVQCWNKDPQQRPSAKGVVDKVNASKNPMLSAAMISLGAFSLRNAKGNLNSGVADPDAINNASGALDPDDIPAQPKRSVK